MPSSKGAFGRSAPSPVIQNIDEILDRPATIPPGRYHVQNIVPAHDSSIGIIGFSFRLTVGNETLSYDVRFMDDHGNDCMDYSVTLPNSRNRHPHLIRSSRIRGLYDHQMGIAEKAMVLKIIKDHFQISGQHFDLERSLGYSHYTRLYQACSDSAVGQVHRSPSEHGKIPDHEGYDFTVSLDLPPDALFKDPIKRRLQVFSVKEGGIYKEIWWPHPSTHALPSFVIRSPFYSHPFFMDRKEALKIVDKIEITRSFNTILEDHLDAAALAQLKLSAQQRPEEINYGSLIP